MVRFRNVSTLEMTQTEFTAYLHVHELNIDRSIANCDFVIQLECVQENMEIIKIVTRSRSQC